jgi:two-component system phosphate regulon sensor histidine kinase PhoR
MASAENKNVALYSAVAVSLLFGAVAALFFFYYCNVDLLFLIISIALFFIISYFIIGYLLDKFINKKIKLIYKTIGEFKGGDLQDKKSAGSLEKVNQVVLEWSEEQRKQIEELKQMAAYRREFLGNISHELKTPIFNIQGYILTLLDGGLEDETINKSFLMKANKSINRMIAIVEDLEEITKLESGVAKLKETQFDMVELIKEVLDFMELKAKNNNAVLNFETSGRKPCLVVADRKRIKQVMINLVDNAIKYGNKDKTDIDISILDIDEKFLIKVSDNGTGIEEKNLPRVFERFYRTDKGRSRDKGGTGLGLAIVKHIIEAHRQTITVTSRKGKGTSFSFTLKKYRG